MKKYSLILILILSCGGTLSAQVRQRCISGLTGGTTQSCKFKTNVVSGDLVVGQVSWFDNTPAISTFSDTLGSTWVKSSITTNTLGGAVHWNQYTFYTLALNGSGVDTITSVLTAGVTSDMQMTVTEYAISGATLDGSVPAAAVGRSGTRRPTTPWRPAMRTTCL